MCYWTGLKTERSARLISLSFEKSACWPAARAQNEAFHSLISEDTTAVADLGVGDVGSRSGQHERMIRLFLSLICTSFQCYHVLWVEVGALFLVYELGKLLAGTVSQSEENGHDGAGARADWIGEGGYRSPFSHQNLCINAGFFNHG